MHWTERVSYYIYQATAEENQNGMHKKSKRYDTFEAAKKDALLIKNDFVGIERHAEFWDGYYNEWCIDHAAGGITAFDF